MTDLIAPSATKNRDIRFDILKAIGLLSIIFAHTEPGDFIDQVRNFDVPLMVLVSGALFAQSYRRKPSSVKAYVQKRFWRLVGPTWCFLTFFFGFSYVIDSLQGKTDFYDWDYIAKTFLLIDGLGYVWIIRVFLIIAIIAPFLMQFRDRLKTDRRYLLALAIVYAIYEIVVTIADDLDIKDPDAHNAKLEMILEFLYWLGYKVAIKSILFYTIAYGCIFGLGTLIQDWSLKFSVRVATVFFSLFVVQAAYFWMEQAEFYRTQEYKYPPQLYYISYAISISIFLYLLVDYLARQNLFSGSQKQPILDFIVFLSSSSMWIYLWHIFWLQYRGSFFTALNLRFLEESQFLRFLAIAFLSIFLTWMQKKIVAKIIKDTQTGRRHASLLSVLFLQ
jgi:fucose 4-O-acetylase-like acetyltransferase